MVDPQALSKVFSRTSWAALAVVLTLAWSTSAPGEPKRVGNADDATQAETPAAETAEDAPAEKAGDDAATGAEGEAPSEEKVLPEDSAKELEELLKDAATGGDSKSEGAKEPAAGVEAKPDKAGEMESEKAPAAEPEDAKEAKSEKPAKADAETEKTTKPEAGKSNGSVDDRLKSAKTPAKKEKGKKGKDFVGKRDQKKDANGVYRFESGAYLIATDVDKDLANDIGAHMDAVYKEYWARLSNFRPNPYAAVKPNEKMPLYVMKRYRDYLTLLQGFGFNAANSGGVFFRSQKGSGLATWVEGQSRLKMYYVLQHEGFHQFADAKLMGSVILADGTVVELPPWVNEGLAEYFGDAVMYKNKMIIGRLDRERLNRMKRAIKEEVTLPFKELMTMNNDRWVARVTAGDKASSLMYDSAWSVCYYLAHGNKNERLAIETYLKMLNDKFVTNPGKDPRGETFEFVFSNNLDAFERSWKAAVARMEPDAWFSSVRHLQWMAAALEEFHKKEIPVKSWEHLKEQLIRHRFKATIRERDIVARGERKEQVEHLEQDFDFPDPAQVEFRQSDDPRLPHGMLITHVVPNILLSWSINADGVLEEDISYLDPPRGQIKKTPAKKPQKPAPVAEKPEAKPQPAKPEVKASPKKADAPKTAAADKPAKKGTIKVGPK